MNAVDILDKSRLLGSSELKLLYVLSDVLSIEEEHIFELLSFDRKTLDFFITTKDEVLACKTHTSINDNPSSEITVLVELIYNLFNKINVSTPISLQLKKRFISKAIEMFNLFIEAGFANKHMVHAFVAYLYFNLSRQDTMFSSEGKLISLREQNRSKWDQGLIKNGLYHLEKSADGSKVTIYHLESAIAAIHCLAKSYRETDWEKVVSVYNKYLSVNESAYVELQRASVIAKIKGAKVGIEEIDKIEDLSKLEENPLLYSTLGNLHLQIHNYSTAFENYKKAYAYAEIEVDRNFYHQKVQICRQRLKMIENYHFYNSF